MLRVTHADLYAEYEAAHEKTIKVLAGYEDQIKQRAGPGYMGEPFPAARQNYSHRWLSYVVPQLVGDDMRVAVDSTMQPEGGEDFELELAGNAWLTDTRLREFSARAPANDMQYNFGVVLCAPEPVAGAKPMEGIGSDWAPGDTSQGAEPRKDIPWAPRFYRIPQKRYFEDALAPDRDSIRLQGHHWVRDKDEVLAEGEKGGWNVQAIREYAGDAQLDNLARPDYGPFGKEVKRNEVVGVDIWVPEYDIPADNPWGVPASPGASKGYHGTIFTLLVNRSAVIARARGENSGGEDPALALMPQTPKKVPDEFPRKPRPWYGSPRGPYVVFGQFTVPEHSLPLGALTACEQEMRELNTDMDVAQRMMRAFKRIMVLARGSDKELKVIKDGVHDWIYRIPGITKDDIHEMELGGLDDQALAHIEFSKQNLETTLGLNEMHSGVVGGVGTATEQTFAENAAQARFAGIRMAFKEGMRDLLWRALWFLYNDNRFGRELPPAAARELVKREMAPMQTVETPDGGEMERLPAPTYLGGERRGIERVPWNALSVDVDIVERAGPEKRAAIAANQLATVQQLVQMATAVPKFPWWKVAEKVGPAIDFPGLAEMFGKPDELAASAIQVAQLMGASQGGQERGGARPSKQAGGGPRSMGGGARPQRSAQQRGPAGGRSSGGSGQSKPKKRAG